MWMRNSPGKCKVKEQTARDRFREVAFDRCFNEKVFRIEGYFKCSTIEIVIRNKFEEHEKYDISLDIDEGVRIIDESFRSDFRRMLEAVQYDTEQQQFYIKLP